MQKTQKTRHPALAVLAMAAVFALSANTAQAAEYIHQTNTEKGYVTVPEHFKSNKTREQVQAEAAEYFKGGNADDMRRGIWPPRTKEQTSGITRQQVMDEYRNQTPEERKARAELYRN
ncbi:hypothetical protein D3C71_1936650 [compost metagenome]